MPHTSPTAAAPAHTNRLARESSPYLLQHAHNPVDWYPWGPEALAAARERGVPILLSVGYSTCYWCHVMERESFEDAAVAALMNERFVCVKLDREERPDIDEIYMSALQAMTGSGGWPMNVFLTPPGARGPDDPGLEPFYAGTYFPPQEGMGRPSWSTVVTRLSEVWQTNRADVLAQAAGATAAVRDAIAETSAPVRIDTSHAGQALANLVQIFDATNGGFGGAPKFPQPVFLEFLLDVRPGISDPAVAGRADRAIRETLDAMALGGIHDQAGGGFHRYATDAAWTVPHFEKMLYDNAQLASVYSRAYRAMRDPLDARVARRTLDYVLREMTDATGAFYSAQDAEVDHREGANYLWTREQIIEALGPDDGAFAASVLGVDAGPNFRDPHHPGDAPRSVLILRDRPEALAAELGLTVEAFTQRLDAALTRLMEVRATRKQPATDDKVLTAWNGLMIAALAEGAVALGDPKYLDAAERGAKAILGTMRGPDGTVLRTARHGKASPTPGVLEDYAFLIRGLIALHRAGALAMRADVTYLNEARGLTEIVFTRFGDPRTGVLYNTPAGSPDLLVRAQSSYDGAVPSGQSVMVHNLLDLAELTSDEGYRESAEAVLASVSADVARSPLGAINSTRALLRVLRANPAFADRHGAAPAPTPALPDDAVRILATVERVSVPAGQVVELPIRIEIDPGHHLNAHVPGVNGMTGLTSWIEGSEAVAVDADWPIGTPYAGRGVPAGVGTLMVHEGAVEVTLRLRRTDRPWNPGERPMILVTYQVCTDEACLMPRTVELDVAIDP
jgi:uncharacterized protein YyaL (SSP411 family)